VAYKLMFTVLVWARCFISLVVTPWGYKAGNRLYANQRPLTRPPIVSSPPSLWLKKDRESDLETGERVVELTGSMALQGWITSEVMQEHMQKLMSQGFMTAVELARANMGIEPHFNLWNYFFHAQPDRGQVRKRRFWVAWTSSSDLSMELIPTSTSLCLDTQTGAKKYGSF
jgi:hypothetical protein